jgi:tRNA(fMet)-specific endonuclease VapC
MKFMLDTNILIYLIKQKPPQVMARFSVHSMADVCVSSITVAELEYGVMKSRSEKNKRTLDGWLQLVHRPAFDEAAARAYGNIRATLESQGTPIGPLDTLIAAHAIAVDATLVTNNVREFARVPGLRIEDWTLA